MNTTRGALLVGEAAQCREWVKGTVKVLKLRGHSEELELL